MEIGDRVEWEEPMHGNKLHGILIGLFENWAWLHQDGVKQPQTIRKPNITVTLSARDPMHPADVQAYNDLADSGGIVDAP